MRVFITGATGFIGRALSLRLLGGGHEIAAWVRNAERARNLLGPGVQLIAASGGTQTLAAEIARAAAVVNLAGEPVLGGRWTEQRRQALWNSRIDLTTSIVDAIRQSPRRPAVLVSASAVGYYGDRGDELLDTRSAPGDDFLARLCRQWEACALRAEQDAGVRVFVPRIGIVLGLDGGALPQMLPPFRFGAGGPLGSGRQWMGWIHLADLVEIIALALEDGRYRGPAIATAPMPVTNREFARTLGRVLHRPSLVPVPAFALRVMFGEGASVLLSGQRVIPALLTEMGFRWHFEKLEAALRNLLTEDDPVIEPLRPNSPRPENPNGCDYLEQRRPHFVLHQSMRVNAPVAEVFSFFSQAQNLGLMTPADMRFQITSAPEQLSRGSRINYRLRVGRLPLRWQTRIEDWQPPNRFIDYQQQGPYRCWWHEHRFQPDGASTLMEDRVYFAPPLGSVGAALNPVFVAPALRKIFRFRAQAIRLRFGGTALAARTAHQPVLE